MLGRKAVFLSGPDGTALFNDESYVQRAGGMPDFVEEIFGGKSLPLLDGDDSMVPPEHADGLRVTLKPR